MTPVIRPTKVLETKAVIEQYKDFGKVEQMFFVFFGRDDLSDGLTIYELVAAFFPDAIITISNKQLVLSWGYRRTLLILAKLRDIFQTGQTPYAQYDEKIRTFVLYNNQSNTLKQLEKRLTNVALGAKEHLANVIDELNLTPKQRRALEQATRKLIIEKALKKKRRDKRK